LNLPEKRGSGSGGFRGAVPHRARAAALRLRQHKRAEQHWRWREKPLMLQDHNPVPKGWAFILFSLLPFPPAPFKNWGDAS